MSDRASSKPLEHASLPSTAGHRFTSHGPQPLELVLDDIKDYAVFLVSLEGRIASWNAGAERLKGYTPEEAIGLPFAALFTADETARGTPEFEMEVALRTGVFKGEGVRVRKDGSRFFADVVLRLIHSGDGAPLGFVKVTRDVTERRRLEELEQIRIEFLERVLAVVSHDLRNPLSSIRMTAYLLRRDPSLSAAHGKMVSRMMSTSARAVRLVNDLLDFTQARFAGSISILPEALDARELLDRTMEEVHDTHPGREIVVKCDGHGSAFWDPDRIAQLVVNLVNNALSHGSPSTPVRLRMIGGGDVIRIDVHNVGDPIPSALLPTLFDAFTKADLATIRRGSVGLGLFIVHQIVRAHRGTIEVRSTEAEGTTFSVTLPRRSIATMPPPAS